MNTTGKISASLLLALLVGTTAAAQPPPPPPPPPPGQRPGPPRPPPPGPPGPRNPTRDRDLAILGDVFTDAQWSDMVALEVDATAAATGEGPRLRSLSAEATVQPVERRSIDQEVLQRIIVDRSRRLAMRAVADAVGDSVGPVMDRRYVQDLITTVSDLLTDRTGMQNTRIEALIGVLVRALLSDALVRMRFPDGDVLDPCAWRKQVFDQGEPPEEAAECRRAPFPAYGERCAPPAAGAEPTGAPLGCGLGSGVGGAFRPWTPAGTTPGARLRMRAYLI